MSIRIKTKIMDLIPKLFIDSVLMEVHGINKQLNQFKMSKQEYLDQTAGNDKIWVTQQFLMRLSKTKANQLQRNLKEISEILYKSWARELSWSEITDSLGTATKILNDEGETNKTDTI